MIPKIFYFPLLPVAKFGLALLLIITRLSTSQNWKKKKHRWQPLSFTTIKKHRWQPLSFTTLKKNTSDNPYHLSHLTHNAIDQTVKTFQTFTQALLRNMGFKTSPQSFENRQIAPKIKQGNKTFSVNYYLFRHVWVLFLYFWAYMKFLPTPYMGRASDLSKIVPFLWSGKGFPLVESNYFFLAFLSTGATLWTLMSGAPERGAHNLQTCRAV
jgi:hypothetical protein